MLQSKPAADGRSKNPFIARMQQVTSSTATDPEAVDPRERSHRHLPILSEQRLLPRAPDERADDEGHQADGSEGHHLAEVAERSGPESEGDDLREAIVGDAAIPAIRCWKANAPSTKNPGRGRRASDHAGSSRSTAAPGAERGPGSVEESDGEAEEGRSARERQNDDER
jgi:hypothetical protein